MMAELPTKESIAAQIMGIFSRRGRRPGEVVPQISIITEIPRQSDRISGLEYCIEKGWIDITNRGTVMLTEEGFSAM